MFQINKLILWVIEWASKNKDKMGVIMEINTDKMKLVGLILTCLIICHGTLLADDFPPSTPGPSLNWAGVNRWGAYWHEAVEGEFINLVNGGLIIKHTDIILPERGGFNFELTRTYIPGFDHSTGYENFKCPVPLGYGDGLQLNDWQYNIPVIQVYELMENGKINLYWVVHLGDGNHSGCKCGDIGGVTNPDSPLDRYLSSSNSKLKANKIYRPTYLFFCFDNGITYKFKKTEIVSYGYGEYVWYYYPIAILDKVGETLINFYYKDDDIRTERVDSLKDICGRTIKFRYDIYNIYEYEYACRAIICLEGDSVIFTRDIDNRLKSVTDQVNQITVYNDSILLANFFTITYPTNLVSLYLYSELWVVDEHTATDNETLTSLTTTFDYNFISNYERETTVSEYNASNPSDRIYEFRFNRMNTKHPFLLTKKEIANVHKEILYEWNHDINKLTKVKETYTDGDWPSDSILFDYNNIYHPNQYGSLIYKKNPFGNEMYIDEWVEQGDDSTFLLLNFNARDNYQEHKYEYDDIGNLTATEIWKEGNFQYTESEYTYDDYGNVHYSFDALENRTTYLFNDITMSGESFSSWNHTYPTMLIFPENLIHTSKDYDIMGRIIKEMDANGNITKYKYDPVGRVDTIIKPGDTEYSPTITYTYDDVNNKKYERIKREYGDITTIIYTYDSYGRIIEKHVAGGGTSYYEYNTFRDMVKLTNPIGNVTYYTYDLLHRKTAIYHPDNTPYDTTDNPKTSYFYNAERYTIPGSGGVEIYIDVVTIINPKGDSITYKYDAAGNIREVIQYATVREYTDPETPEGNWYVGDLEYRLFITQYFYSDRGLLDSIIDPRGNVSRFIYDYRGLLMSKTDPDRQTLNILYDKNARIRFSQSERDEALGQWIYNKYDKNGRLVENGIIGVTPDPNLIDDQTYPNSLTPGYVRMLEMTYDVQIYEPPGFYGQDENTLGYLTKIICDKGNGGEAENVEVYDYDERGRINHKGIGFLMSGNRIWYELRYLYDSADNLTDITYPDGTIISYTYNNKNQLTQVDGTQILAEYQYYQSGLLFEINHGNEGLIRYTYNSRNFLETIDCYNGYYRDYIYDDNGNRRAEYDYGGSLLAYYGYDEIGRLVDREYNPEGNPPDEPQFNFAEYDLSSNIRKKNIQEFRYLSIDNLLILSMDKNYTYDENGNLISRSDGLSLYYDYLNRLKKVFKGDTTINYEYNCAGLRSKKKVESEVGGIKRTGIIEEGEEKTVPGGPSPDYSIEETYYIYDEGGNLLCEIAGKGHNSFKAKYIYGADGLTSKIDCDERNMLGNGDFEYCDESGEQPSSWIGDFKDYSTDGSMAKFGECCVKNNYSWPYQEIQVIAGEIYCVSAFFMKQTDGAEGRINLEGEIREWFDDATGEWHADTVKITKVGVSSNGTGYQTHPGKCGVYFPAGPNWEKVWVSFRAENSGNVLVYVMERNDTEKYVWIDGVKAELGEGPTGFQEEKTYYYTKDVLGSPVVITDDNMDVVKTYEYDVYGNLRESSGYYKDNMRFTGHYWDEETGFYYCKNRYYDPEIGRFITPDLLNISNPYSYCLNNPISYIDPNGLQTILQKPKMENIWWASEGPVYQGIDVYKVYWHTKPANIALATASIIPYIGSLAIIEQWTTGRISDREAFINLCLNCSGIIPLKYVKSVLLYLGAIKGWIGVLGYIDDSAFDPTDAAKIFHSRYGKDPSFRSYTGAADAANWALRTAAELKAIRLKKPPTPSFIEKQNPMWEVNLWREILMQRDSYKYDSHSGGLGFWGGGYFYSEPPHSNVEYDGFGNPLLP